MQPFATLVLFLCHYCEFLVENFPFGGRTRGPIRVRFGL
jgi:hypothetical protein